MTYNYAFLDSAKDPHKTRYVRFIESRRSRSISSNQKIERHHVHPSSLGGVDIGSNIIELLPREHIIAHVMLWKAIGGRMTQALSFMIHHPRRSLRDRLKMPFSFFESILTEVRQSLSEDNHQKGLTRADTSRKRMSTAHADTYFITDGKETRKVKESVALQLIDQGWVFGLSLEAQAKGRKASLRAKERGSYRGRRSGTLGKVRVYEEGRVKYYSPEDAPAKRVKAPGPNAGLIPLHRDGVNKRIRPEELDAYLTSGWQRGSKNKPPKVSVDGKQRQREGASGLWIKKDGEQLRIPPELLEEALVTGWARGRLHFDLPDQKGERGYFYGKKHTPETIERMRDLALKREAAKRNI